jgi:hypothetical protein
MPSHCLLEDYIPDCVQQTAAREANSILASQKYVSFMKLKALLQLSHQLVSFCPESHETNTHPTLLF